jgi:hypothetical protein
MKKQVEQIKFVIEEKYENVFFEHQMTKEKLQMEIYILF